MLGLQVLFLQNWEQLFADDIGILIPAFEANFQEVKACIQL